MMRELLTRLFGPRPGLEWSIHTDNEDKTLASAVGIGATCQYIVSTSTDNIWSWVKTSLADDLLDMRVGFKTEQEAKDHAEADYEATRP